MDPGLRRNNEQGRKRRRFQDAAPPKMQRTPRARANPSYNANHSYLRVLSQCGFPNSPRVPRR